MKIYKDLGLTIEGLHTPEEPRSVIHALFVDWGNVLGRSTSMHIQRDISQKWGIPRDRFDQVWGPIIQSHATGEIDEAGVWRELAKATGLTPPILSDGEESLLVQAHIQNREPNTEVYKILEQVKQQQPNVILTVFSDNHSALWEYEKNQRSFAMFDALYPSQITGFLKTNPKAYPYVLKKLNDAFFPGAPLQPAEVVIIDDKEKNTVVAIQQNWNAIVYQDPEQLANELAVRFRLKVYAG